MMTFLIKQRHPGNDQCAMCCRLAASVAVNCRTVFISNWNAAVLDVR